MIATPHRKTPCSACAKACRKSACTAGGRLVGLGRAELDAAAEPRDDARGKPASWSASREAKIAPKIATPNEPPIERKNVAVEVATPMFSGGASFWTTSTSTCITSPMPTPTTSM